MEGHDYLIVTDTIAKEFGSNGITSDWVQEMDD